MHWFLATLCCLGCLLGQADAASKKPIPPKATAVGPLATTVTATVQWDWTQAMLPDSFTVYRCQPTGTSKVCTPTTALSGMPIPGTARSYQDTSTTAGLPYCWTVRASKTGYTQSPPATAPDGMTPYVCLQMGGVLPVAGTTTITPMGQTLRVSWLPPTFGDTTVPASSLLRYEVYRRGDPLPPGPDWAIAGTVAPTVTTWDDVAPLSPRTCYQIRSVFLEGYTENATTCASAPLAPLVSPSNLRAVTP